MRKFARRSERTPTQTILRWLAAFIVIHLILCLPDRIDDLGAKAFVRLPLELPLIVLGLVAFSGKWRTAFRALVVLVLAALLLFKLASMGAYFGFDRPFNLLVDALMVPVVLGTISQAAGFIAAAGAVAAVAAILAFVIGVLAWATGVIANGMTRQAQLPVAGVAVVGVLMGFVPEFQSRATWDSSFFVREQAVAIARGLEDAQRFSVELLQTPFSDMPADSRLANLKGKDVLLIFVESYGRAALDNPAYAPLIRGTLKKFGAALAEKGFAASSAWMKSPTFGGESYLAHSSSVSGLWVENQQRYTQLLRSSHETLIGDFNAGGWRTVTVMPEITMPWPEVDYFKFAKVYTAPDLGYKGKSFEYMTMPDQYTLAEFARRELTPDHPPVMAQIALISSHIPWAPIPKPVPWEDVGDGSIFTTARTPETANDVWRDPRRVPEFYALSIDYTLQTLMTFVTTYAGDNTLVIFLGDHQPMTFIAGEGASHEVPVHMIARDPALIAALDQGSWTPGMEPDAASPSWAMDKLRERILKAYTPPS